MRAYAAILLVAVGALVAPAAITPVLAQPPGCFYDRCEWIAPGRRRCHYVCPRPASCAPGSYQVAPGTCCPNGTRWDGGTKCLRPYTPPPPPPRSACNAGSVETNGHCCPSSHPYYRYSTGRCHSSEYDAYVPPPNTYYSSPSSGPSGGQILGGLVLLGLAVGLLYLIARAIDDAVASQRAKTNINALVPHDPATILNMSPEEVLRTFEAMRPDLPQRERTRWAADAASKFIREAQHKTQTATRHFKS